MNSRLMDVVGVIGSYVSDNWEQLVDDEEIKGELQNQGYSEREIHDAFKWIEEATIGSINLKAEDDEENFSDQSLRPLTATEKLKISTKAQGLVLRCLQRGLIDVNIADDIIDRAMQFEADEIGYAEMKRIVSLALFSQMQEEWKELIQNSASTMLH